MFLKLINVLILFDLVQLEEKHFQKNFYKIDDELYNLMFEIDMEVFDIIEYVNELIDVLNKMIDYYLKIRERKISNLLFNK